MTTTEATMPCYCKNDTPCQPCLDTAYEDMDREAFNAEAAALNVESDADADRRTFEAASRDFYIPGWTHADIDTRVWDHKILDDMKVEAEYNPDMARALRALYGEDVYSYADYIRDTKGEMVNDCDCNSCAEEGKWFNQ